MPRRTISLLILLLVATNAFVFISAIGSVHAGTFLAIFIRPDGSIEPPEAPIQRDGDVYTLTEDIYGEYYGVEIERNYTIFDGNGHSMVGVFSGVIGVNVEPIFADGLLMNVTIRNLKITGFGTGIVLMGLNCSVLGNDISAEGAAYAGCGIYIAGPYNQISRNNITGFGEYDIRGIRSCNNYIAGNLIANSNRGIDFEIASYNNIIVGNNITGNNCGVYSYYQPTGYMIYHNNFVDNVEQTQFDIITGQNNTWDNGFPSGGNYWSNYNGTDDQGDGIGDTPYCVDAENVDNYPLMQPYAPYDGQTIYLRANGGVYPIGAPIEPSGDVYTLTGNIRSKTDGIVVERDNVVLDGSGYAIESTGSSSNGIFSSQKSNITIENLRIRNFTEGIRLYSCSNTTINGNSITNNAYYGIWLDSCSNSNLSGNTLASNSHYGICLASSMSNSINGNTIIGNAYSGIYLGTSSNNSISRNNITNNNLDGIWLGYSSNYNSISQNNVKNNNQCGIYIGASSNSFLTQNSITANSRGLCFDYSSNNIIQYNNFVNNSRQVDNQNPDNINVWDNGCEGNYYSDYNGTDVNHDGIGDIPWPIDVNNTDYWPLMNVFWNPCDINHDLKVDMKDIGTSARAFGTVPGDLLWNPHADITSPTGQPDGKVNMMDIGLIARHFMEHYS